MNKILIFGNSGSGKSTLAKFLQSRGDHVAVPAYAHLDLDTLAWLPTTPPQRSPLETAHTQIQEFIATHSHWVMEGCYTDLLELAQAEATTAIFLDLPVEQCQDHARQRSWEPHKYATPAEQDANLDMLLQWIGDYPHRDGELSLAAHNAFFEAFAGEKHRYTAPLMYGKCLCEQVVYTIEGELGPVFNCHCLKCRRWHGAALRTRASIQRSQFRWLKGEDQLGDYMSSPQVHKYFCKTCGSALISSYDNLPDILGVPLGGVEGAVKIATQAHIFVDSKASWYTLCDGSPQYAEWPDSEAKVRETHPSVKPTTFLYR